MEKATIISSGSNFNTKLDFLTYIYYEIFNQIEFREIQVKS